MQITKDKVIQINYTLKNDGGEVIDSSEGADPLAYLHGHHGIIPGLENALEGKPPVTSWMSLFNPMKAMANMTKL